MREYVLRLLAQRPIGSVRPHALYMDRASYTRLLHDARVYELSPCRNGDVPYTFDGVPLYPVVVHGDRQHVRVHWGPL